MAKKKTILKAVAILLASSVALFFVYYKNHIYPGVLINNQQVGGKSQSEVIEIVKSKTIIPTQIQLTSDSQNFTVAASTLNFSYDFEKTAGRAILLGRTGNLSFDIGEILKAIAFKKNYNLEINLDQNKLDDFITTISEKLTVPKVPPSINLENGKITINTGKAGSKIDKQILENEISKNLSVNNLNPIQIQIDKDDQSLTSDEVIKLEEKAKNLISKKININFDNQTFEIKDSSLINLLGFKENLNKENDIKIIDEISKKFERPTVDAKFDFQNGKVNAFEADQDGIKVKRQELENAISQALVSLTTNSQANINLPTEISKAQIKVADINNLGIKELIGSGTSHFAGSITSRVHNVNLGASKINDALVSPGDTFSFANTVGDISVLTGFQQAYVIQDGKTVLGDGGGICQVSTTLFRAVMNAGLPIIERHAHAYRVHYYEEDADPGLDATVFVPSVDFKFKNDTSNYILIQSKIDLDNLILTFNIYGTHDGRTSEVTKPVLWDYKPAPAASYTDDPTLARGIVKQIDFAASGIKSKFNYTVKRNGEIINDQTFYSDFQPWQAKFLVGTR